MPKTAQKKRNGGSAAQGSPYAAKQVSANNVFKMNTDLGQHVLKNPGIADAIVNKADLKQSDVRSLHAPRLSTDPAANTNAHRSSSKSAPAQAT